jgi:hypothetical protein
MLSPPGQQAGQQHKQENAREHIGILVGNLRHDIVPDYVHNRVETVKSQNFL